MDSNVQKQKLKRYLLISIAVSILVVIVIRSELLIVERSTQVERIIGRSIEEHGGWEAWLQLDTLRYEKHTRLTTETGEVERDLIQTHVYSLHPFDYALIEWKEGDSTHAITYDGEESRRLINGQEQVEFRNRDINTVLGAQYVMCMPFKLRDPRANLIYIGLDTLDNDRTVHVIEVQYNEQKENHPWRYYFDVSNYQLIGNRVAINGRFSFIENLQYVTHHDIMWNAERTSHFVDEDLNKLYLRATYWNTLGTGY